MSFEKLPVELQKMILSNLDAPELIKTAKVSTSLHKQSSELLNELHAGYPRERTLSTTSDYYAVGAKVEISEPSNLWDKGYPYRKERKAIPENEIKNAIPKQGTMKLFRTQKEAQSYALETAEENHSTIERMAAVFHVKLKESIVSTITKNEITPALYTLFRQGPKIKATEYVPVDVSNLKFLSGQVSDYPGIALAGQENKEDPCACVLM
ncbi:F-box protein [Legionella sp. WA2024007413]